MYIGIDLGTTVCKAALYDENGALCGEYCREYSLITKGGYIEQDANEWWDMTKEALSCFGTSDITALSVSTQGISFVPVGRDGNPLCNAISWLDNRAEAELSLLESHFSEGVLYQKTGKPLNPLYTLPKLMWFKKYCPEIYDKAHKLLMPLDFLNFKLTGDAVTDYTMASGTMLFNMREKAWDRDLLKFSGISEEKLPEVKCMGTKIGGGKYNVILGGQDQKLAAIGAGIRESEGACTVSIGTATAITKLKPPGFMPAEDSLPLFLFDDRHVAAEHSIMTTGAAIKWLSGVMGESYAEMDSLAEQSPRGANGIKFDLSLEKAGGISGLMLSTQKGDIVRALYESICREIKNGIQMLGGAEKIRVFGGGSKSKILCSILADMTGLNVRASETAETAALGAAILAREAMGC